jgi:hypothetical protein
MAVVPLDFHNNKTLFLEREKVFVKDKTCLLLLEHDFFLWQYRTHTAAVIVNPN